MTRVQPSQMIRVTGIRDETAKPQMSYELPEQLARPEAAAVQVNDEFSDEARPPIQQV